MHNLAIPQLCLCERGSRRFFGSFFIVQINSKRVHCQVIVHGVIIKCERNHGQGSRKCTLSHTHADKGNDYSDHENMVPWLFNDLTWTGRYILSNSCITAYAQIVQKKTNDGLFYAKKTCDLHLTKTQPIAEFVVSLVKPRFHYCKQSAPLSKTKLFNQ